MCSSEGDIPCHTNSLNVLLLWFAIASMLLSYSKHLDLSLPSNDSIFFNICLLTSPLPMACVTPCVTACVIASVKLAVFAGDMLFSIRECTALLVLVGAHSPFVVVGWYCRVNDVLCGHGGWYQWWCSCRVAPLLAIAAGSGAGCWVPIFLACLFAVVCCSAMVAVNACSITSCMNVSLLTVSVASRAVPLIRKRGGIAEQSCGTCGCSHGLCVICVL